MRSHVAMGNTTPENEKRLDSGERRILVVTCFGHFMSHFNMLVFPALLIPLATRLSMSMGTTLGLSFWMYLLFGVTALPWGVVADRVGAKPLMLTFYLGAGFSGLSAALLLDTPLYFSLSLAGLGLFSGIYHPTGLGLISKEVRRVSMAMGYNGMFGNLGLAVAPLLAGLMNWLWGVRVAYCIVGLMNLTGLGLTLLISTTSKGEPRKRQPEPNTQSIMPFFILLIAMMLGGLAYRGATVILPAYFELKTPVLFEFLSKRLSGTLSTNLVATSISALIYFVGILGQYSGGRVAEKYEPKYCYLLYHAVTIPIAFLISLSSNLPLVAATMTYFFFLLGMQPIENTLVANLTPKKFHHSAFGMKFILTFGVGSLAVKIIERIENQWGIEATFICIGFISMGLVATIFVLLASTRNRPRSCSAQ
ncbi:MAG: hypothetical protein DRH12_06015 [Deltaproteobacteria bacterium]|nr:MAG: hypothetical protein DRH12_06015 [Deltaproteobacteria bacterium]